MSVKKPVITKDCVKTLVETKFLSMVDLQYEEGKHYYDATRHTPDRLTALKTEEEFRSMTADAVTCVVIVRTPAEGARLLLINEYRYPVGQFLLSPPAGLVDASDGSCGNEALFAAARREIYEETGLQLRDTDRLSVINPLVFSSPGMTDECNALICAVAETEDLSPLTQEHAEGSECFDGFVLLDRKEAEETLRRGTDAKGIFYSVYTYIALTYFLSGCWDS